MPYKDPEKQREYMRKWMQARRQEWIAANGPCRLCGSSDDLEVDHIDPATKRWAPREIWGRKKADQEAELAKCQVLCRRCHEEKSRREQQKPVTHGTHTGYSHYGCRCPECTRAHADYNAGRKSLEAPFAEGA